MRFVLRSKIHQAIVTEANLDYIGSITIDEDLIKKGEEIIIMGFELTDKPIKALNILVDKNNKFVKYLKRKMQYFQY